jgi:nicotinate-nucleotide adenylyltransferase
VRIGVFGGTFDPVHWGHLVLAEEALTVAQLDRILFVPSASPPHKQGRLLTPFSHRLEMLRLAIRGVEGFEASDVESDPSRPHYSLDTLSALAAAHPDDELRFIVGSDSLLEMSGWHRPEEIAARWPLVVLARPGFDPARAEPRFTNGMIVVDGISVSISSTLIRRRLGRGATIRFLVPAVVADYARMNSLYQDTE